jgi:hypothetical protein
MVTVSLGGMVSVAMEVLLSKSPQAPRKELARDNSYTGLITSSSSPRSLDLVQFMTSTFRITLFIASVSAIVLALTFTTSL